MAKPVALFVVGTRPDAIKSAPVVLEFQRWRDVVDTVVVSTGQHREMLDQALGAFGLTADRDLQVMQHGQSLASVTSRVLEGLDGAYDRYRPDVVFAQGDTTTTFVAGLAAFYRKIPFAHIEAGLRTETVWDPFPEEFNRRASALTAALHFAPTAWAADNLDREGVPKGTVFVTGNTGIDAVRQVSGQTEQSWYPDHHGRIVLLTTHRRENWGDKQRAIAEAALETVRRFEDVLLVVPMHRNPQVREVLQSVLSGHPRIDLIEPPDYAPFVKLLERSYLALTDSGGVQEEAPTFGVPVLVLRETTERPEGVRAGTARLVGTDKDDIMREASRILGSKADRDAMAHAVSPYGDGAASRRIRWFTLKSLGIETSPESPWA
ncbi:MAG: UDP-N-acetylglucosamine 2-epimerase (non-hydrolyzing) [Armatimonadetes bacterium]|nr:UDP-N-acetylglucosamine 2-epimerase (non-hydrolyzing) [Armatimonadota bacterium]